MKANIQGLGEVELDTSIKALEVYSERFSSDMVSDVFGVIDLTGGTVDTVDDEFVLQRLKDALPDGKALPRGTEKLVRDAFPAPRIAKLDYTLDNWTSYPRALWAMLKSADDATADYTDWAAATVGIDLRALSNVLYAVMRDSYLGGEI